MARWPDRPAIDRFMDKVSPEPNSGCWLWLGAMNGNGYGVFRLPERNIFAHRFAYEAFVQPIPNGLYGCHKCDVRLCANPEHVFPGSPFDNQRDASNKMRMAHGTAHPQARLSPEIVRLIRGSASTGADLARQYGVTRATVRKVRDGLTWRHVK